MDRNTKELIQSRARRLAPFLADHLQHQDPADWEKSQAYKFCWLLLKGPRSFLEQFRYSDMRLCEEAIQNVYWELRGEFPGPAQLLEGEKRLIQDHNLEAARYQSQQEVRPRAIGYAERVVSVVR